MRRHQAFLKQLRTTLDLARSEPPPPGASSDDVTRRIRLLERMIEDTERIGFEARRQNEEDHRRRYCAAERAKLELESAMDQQQQEQDQRHQRNATGYQDIVSLMNHRKQRILEERTGRCRLTVDTAMAKLQEKGQTREAQREAQLTALLERRRLETERHTNALREREGHVSSVIQRRDEKDADHYDFIVQRYEQHCKSIDEKRKLRAAEMEQERSNSARRHRSVSARGRASRVSVTLGGLNGAPPTITVVEKTYEARLAEVMQEEQRRRKRAEDEQRSRQEYARFRASRSADRQRATEERLDLIDTERQRRNWEQKERIVAKIQLCESEERRRRDQQKEAGEKKAASVLAHIQKADHMEEERVARIAQKQFAKWAGQADSAAERLMRQYAMLASDSLTRTASGNVGVYQSAQTVDAPPAPPPKSSSSRHHRTAGRDPFSEGSAPLAETELDDVWLRSSGVQPHPNSAGGSAKMASLTSAQRIETVEAGLRRNDK